MENPGRLSLFLLFLLLAVHFSILFFRPWPTKPAGDERYYVARAKEILLEKEIPRAEGKGDWRPVGYPVFLALCGAITGNWSAVRVVCATIQFGLMAIVLLAFQTLAGLVWKKSYWLFIIAILFGIQPWTFEHSRSMLPDSLTASFTSLGLLALFGFLTQKGRIQNLFLISSIFVLSITIFLRPEMIVMAPVLIGTALILKQENRKLFLRYFAFAALIFLVFVVIQVSYRIFSTGSFELYGHFSILKRGAHNWTDTWFCTENVAYARFLHGDQIRRREVEAFPEHAFADDWERNEIKRALDLVKSKKVYDVEIDRIFQSVADKRIHDNFLVNSVLTRLWRTFLLWFNFEDNERFATILGASTWRANVAIGASYSLRAVILLLAGYAFYSTITKLRNGTAGWHHRLTALMLVCVVTRTVMMGLVLGWLIDRYALVAWPAMIWCAVSGMMDLVHAREVV